MPFGNSTNQTLPTPNNPRGGEENVVRQWLTYWQTYLANFNIYRNRLIGGTGFDSNEIADKAIISRNYMPQTNRVYSSLAHGSAILTNGNGGTVTATDSVTTTFANARVKLKGAHSFEPISNAGSYTMVSYIERSSSPLFTTSTTIAQGSQVVTITNNGAQTAWATILADGVDTLATAGTYYYRYRVAFYVYNNVGATSNTAITTVGLLTRTNYLEWEVTNGSTL